jgi:diguanylate cyclase (GGDEF)-like protein
VSTVNEPTATPPSAHPGAPAPFNEALRLQTLENYAVLDTPREQAYDDLVTLASAVCRTPIALVSLIDHERQWFKASVGLGTSQTPREQAFCAHAILQPDQVLEVPDAQLDARFANNPLVTGDPNIRFYAGAPLVSSEGLAVGTVCVIDRMPRTLSGDERKALQSLARQVVAQLELRKAMAGLELQSMTDPLTSMWNRRSLDRMLRSAWEQFVLNGVPLSLVMIDIDHFKRVNDEFGHPAGDDVLAQVASVIRSQLEPGEAAARLGGEEFCVILPGRDAVRAQALAEAVRHGLRAAAWAHRPVTASFGVASSDASDGSTPSVLLARADRALYMSKRAGRDRVTLFEHWA